VVVVAMTDLETPLNLIDLHCNFFPREKRAPKIAQAAEVQVQRPLTMLGTILGGSSYVLRARFTVADLNVASVLWAARLSAISMAPFPHIVAWAKRCHERPAALAVQAMRQPGA
jgi:glutathione S-transferase